MMLNRKGGGKGRAEYPVDCTPMSVVGLMTANGKEQLALFKSVHNIWLRMVITWRKKNMTVFHLFDLDDETSMQCCQSRQCSIVFIVSLLVTLQAGMAWRGKRAKPGI